MARKPQRFEPRVRAGGRAFARTQGRRPGKKTALIVCEDEKVAPHYFRALCAQLGINSASVHIPPNVGSAPISVVEFAEEKYHRDGGYDKVFCVFDKDQHESYRRAIQKVGALSTQLNSALPIVAATAVPCFEVWLLLHFERSDRPMRSCAEVERALKRHLPGYLKGDGAITPQLLQRTERAIQNSRWLLKQQAAAGTDNPSTKIHEVVTYLSDLADEG